VIHGDFLKGGAPVRSVLAAAAEPLLDARTAAVLSASVLSSFEVSTTSVVYVYYVGLRGPSSGLGADSRHAA
jgi:hypothetical protein